jgi:hypothetical protein
MKPHVQLIYANKNVKKSMFQNCHFYYMLIKMLKIKNMSQNCHHAFVCKLLRDNYPNNGKDYVDDQAEGSWRKLKVNALSRTCEIND